MCRCDDQVLMEQGGRGKEAGPGVDRKTWIFRRLPSPKTCNTDSFLERKLPRKGPVTKVVATDCSCRQSG